MIDEGTAMARYAYYGIVAPDDGEEAERMSKVSWLVYRLYGAILWFTRNQPNEWGQCPWCGFGKDDWEWFMYKEPWFEYASGGQYAAPGEPTVHWFDGLQTCPRCWYKWWVSDSD